MEANPATDTASEPRTDYADHVRRACTHARRIELVADWTLQEFDRYYVESRHMPAVAQKAFEQHAASISVALSKQRLAMYSLSIEALGEQLTAVFPSIADDESLWDEVERRYLARIGGRYEADLAFAYVHSLRRILYRGEWKPVEYSFSRSSATTSNPPSAIYRAYPVEGRVQEHTIVEILKIPGFGTPYRDICGDAALVAERLNACVHEDGRPPRKRIHAIEMIDAGFYRNRGAYLVGRSVLAGGDLAPFVLALLNDERGIYVDAVLDTEADAHNIFSSTLANFHVTNPYYRELSSFLHSVMPKRPLGLHYSTIGYNHVGKVAVMNELQRELSASGEVLQTAIGFKGTVAIGFSAPDSDYNLKVIRDQPTAGYKWGKFEGIDAVLEKYRRVHDINRTGSMLDDIIYYNLKLDGKWFDPQLLEELLEQASSSASSRGDAVVFKYLIVQRRVTPLPVFLQTASPADAETAIVNLGYCIKNNAAANIFNKDLDARNYGVSRLVKVYLFDYDALEPFTQVKVRTNTDRIDGEEDEPDWFYEDGVVFLPEEIEAGLRIPSRELRRLFRRVHGDLSTVEYWERMQNDLRRGEVPSIRTYPEARELRRT